MDLNVGGISPPHLGVGKSQPALAKEYYFQVTWDMTVKQKARALSKHCPLLTGWEAAG